MTCAICTLFEGDYHFGLAALSNSLFSHGFKGSIYAGYRGKLPDWALHAREDSALDWPGGKTLEICPELQLHFLPLETNYHLTNYKPDFMIGLWEGPAKQATAMFYFDPDIILNESWVLFEKWVSCGVALCEDVNSPMLENYPRRIAWRTFFAKSGIILNFKESVYVNGGFIGLTKNNQDFLGLWQKLQEIMSSEIGGLNRSSLNGNTLPEAARGVFSPFAKTDQDALNATVEAFKGTISVVGKEGMGLIAGSALMYHALDQPKPWKKNLLKRIFSGHIPTAADKNYWKNSADPICAYSPARLLFKKLTIELASGIGRFYRRN